MLYRHLYFSILLIYVLCYFMFAFIFARVAVSAESLVDPVLTVILLSLYTFTNKYHHHHQCVEHVATTNYHSRVSLQLLTSRCHSLQQVVVGWILRGLPSTD